MIQVPADLAAFKKILADAGDKLVVVDFTATWCGPCKMIGPIFKEQSEMPENKNVIFVKVDVDEADDISGHLEIKCMPTFHFYKKGEKVLEFAGANADTLLDSLKALRT